MTTQPCKKCLQEFSEEEFISTNRSYTEAEDEDMAEIALAKFQNGNYYCNDCANEAQAMIDAASFKGLKEMLVGDEDDEDDEDDTDEDAGSDDSNNDGK